LVLLPFAEQLIATRRTQWEHYHSLLSSISEIHLLKIPAETEHNGSYFPLLNLTPAKSEKIIAALAEEGVEARRYFHPSLNTVPYMKGAACPISEAVAASVFCLPLYHDLTESDREFISEIVRKNL